MVAATVATVAVAVASVVVVMAVAVAVVEAVVVDASVRGLRLVVEVGIKDPGDTVTTWRYGPGQAHRDSPSLSHTGHNHTAGVHSHRSKRVGLVFLSIFFVSWKRFARKGPA
uniref:Uncharacterized protein n=1 Tax=Anopheles culicifacies TaxID=139723 RepID=A0A182MW54_9DIPT